MFQLKPLDAPEVVTVPGMQVTLTHECRILHLDPRKQEEAVTVRVLKGFLDAEGNFQDFGEHQVTTMDKTGLDALLATPTGVKLDDIAPAIVARTAEKAKAEAKRVADEAKAKADADKVKAPKP